MRTADLVYIGIRGTVVALERATGKQVWATRLKGWDFVNVLLDGAEVLASCNGEVFCLDALTGESRWHNPLKGFGTGLSSIVTESSRTAPNSVMIAEKRWRDQQASSA